MLATLFFFKWFNCQNKEKHTFYVTFADSYS